ncbi:MAG: Na/Pi symporter, partial [Catalinimonas sp.]
QIISATANPFISLFIGLLATATLQSSSTTTSLIVAAVAAGTIPLESAVPFVMGANVGTTVTSTIVAITHVVRAKEFRRAFAAATLHDLFNLLTTLVLFPLEYYFGLLSRLAAGCAALLQAPGAPVSRLPGLVDVLVRPLADAVTALLAEQALLLVFVASALLFFSIQQLSVVMRRVLIGESRKRLNRYVFGSDLKALLWGTGLTAGVQSSSVMSSLLVPLVATGKVTLQRAFPFLIGANVGTTFTAVLAALAQSGPALSIALAHVLFNLIGALLFFPLPAVRRWPVSLAEALAHLNDRSRIIGFLYLMALFFLMPFLLIYTATR